MNRIYFANFQLSNVRQYKLSSYIFSMNYMICSSLCIPSSLLCTILLHLSIKNFDIVKFSLNIILSLFHPLFGTKKVPKLVLHIRGTNFGTKIVPLQQQNNCNFLLAKLTNSASPTRTQFQLGLDLYAPALDFIRENYI